MMVTCFYLKKNQTNNGDIYEEVYVFNFIYDTNGDRN